MRIRDRLMIATVVAVLSLAPAWAAEQEKEAPAQPAAPAPPPKLTTPTATPLRSFGSAGPQVSSKLINVTVNVSSDKERAYEANRQRDITSNQVKEVAVKKTIEIAVRNMSRGALEGLKVTYNVMGMDLEFDNPVVARTASVTISVPIGKQEIVKGDPALFVERPAHTEMKGSRNVRVPKSGTKYTGYGVQIYKGETLIYEWFDPSSLKDDLKTAVPIDSDRNKKK